MSTPTPPSEAEFRQFHARTSPRVYSYVRRHCLETDCDDVIAEVYLVAWRRWSELPTEPLTWLLATARKVLANHWRARDRRQRLAAELRGVQELAAPDPSSRVVERAYLLTVVAELEADDREVLLLVGWDGLNSAGAAKVLGITAAAARARLSRARRRLAARLESSPPASQTHQALLMEGN